MIFDILLDLLLLWGLAERTYRLFRPQFELLAEVLLWLVSVGVAGLVQLAIAF